MLEGVGRGAGILVLFPMMVASCVKDGAERWKMGMFHNHGGADG